MRNSCLRNTNPPVLDDREKQFSCRKLRAGVIWWLAQSQNHHGMAPAEWQIWRENIPYWQFTKFQAARSTETLEILHNKDLTGTSIKRKTKATTTTTKPQKMSSKDPHFRCEAFNAKHDFVSSCFLSPDRLGLWQWHTQMRGLASLWSGRSQASDSPKKRKGTFSSNLKRRKTKAQLCFLDFKKLKSDLPKGCYYSLQLGIRKWCGTRLGAELRAGLMIWE